MASKHGWSMGALVKVTCMDRSEQGQSRAQLPCKSLSLVAEEPMNYITQPYSSRVLICPLCIHSAI